MKPIKGAKDQDLSDLKDFRIDLPDFQIT